MEQTQSTRGRLALLVAAILGLAASAPTVAHAVTFSAPTNLAVGLAPQSAAVSDFNGDSKLDLAVANEFSNNLSVLLGGPGGSFGAPTSLGVGGHPTTIAIGDFNGDSDPDLAVANYASNDVSIMLGAAGGSFTGPTSLLAGTSPTSVAVGEFDGDSDPDLAVTNEGTDNVSVLLGSAAASFTGPTNFAVGNSPQSVAVGKFDGDSLLDLAVTNKLSNDVSVLVGGSGGTFSAPSNFAAGSAPISVAVGRFDGDSDLDLAVVNELSHDVSVLLGAAGAGFSAPTNFAVGSLPDAVTIGEFNGDSDPDLAVANQASDNFSILLGAAGGSFGAATHLLAGDGPTSIAVGDFNGDAASDLAVTNEISNTLSLVFATPPETTIGTGPTGFTNDSTPTFTFSSNDPSSTFRCRVDSGAFTSCASPHTTAVLADGAHTFEVRATDDAGRVDPTTASLPFTVDTASPSLPTLTAVVPASPANDNNPRVKGTAETGSTVRLYSASTAADCTPANLVATDAESTFGSAGIQLSVADNSTTNVRATATDAAGNVSACSTTRITYVEVSPPPTGDPAPPGGGGGAGGSPIGSPVGGPPGAGGGLSLGGVSMPDRSAPAIAVTGRTVTMQAGGVVSVRLSCPASEPGGCEGIVSLRKRTISLGRTSFKVAGGKLALVKVRLSKKRQRLVKNLRRVRILVIVNVRDRAGNAGTTKKALTLRARA